MRVEVRLFATLARFLPSGHGEGAVRLEVPAGSTVRDIVHRLAIPADLERIALVNGRESSPETVLRPDDVVTLFPPLAGG